MNKATMTIIYLIIFAVIDTLIPVPITSLLLIYVILEKPPWFKILVSDIYEK